MDANAVEIADGASKVRVEFDAATGLPSKQIYSETDMRGAPSEVKETFSDWRDVGGVKLPFKVQIEQGGKPQGVVTVSDIKINTGLDPAELSKKPK